MPTVINVISGKGGTGKTLLTAVLAEMLGNKGLNVLVVDMDIFVRGLTALLYFQKDESLKITNENEWSVSDFFQNDLKGTDYVVSISRYRSFDVFPSVSVVNEILKFDIMPNSSIEANRILGTILTRIPQKYDYIFLDSRAGYDELIGATHRKSNFSICVEEDDNISMVTSENLISQLKNSSNTPILRIKNKTRQIQNTNAAMGLDFVGSIPFDADVMASFGTRNFRNEIDRSLYKDYLTKVWNSLAKKMKLGDELPEDTRISPIGVPKIERQLSMLPSLKRVMFIYGIILTLLGILLSSGIMKYNFIHNMLSNPLQIIGLVGTILGIILLLYSVLTREKKK